MQIGTFIGTPALLSAATADATVYPLDEVAGAVACYDLWKRREGYSGAAIQVTRTSDSTTQDIGFVGAELDTAALETFCAGTDGYVTTWYDQGANGDDLTIAGNSFLICSQGSTVTDSSGRPTIYYEGDNGQMTGTLTATTATTQSMTAFLVAKPRSEVASAQQLFRLVATGASTAREQALLLTDGRYFQFHLADADSNTQWDADQLNTIGFHHQITIVDIGTTTFKMWNNLTQEVDEAHAEGATTLENVEIGDTSSPAFEIQSLIIYPQLSQVDRETVYAALNAQHLLGPDALTGGALLPETWRWQADLRTFIGNRVESDFDITPAAFTWDSTYDDEDDLHRMWLELVDDPNSLYVSDDIWSESKWYMLDDGASAGIEGSGALRLPHVNEGGSHNYLLATQGAWLYQFVLTKSGGANGNPFYQDSGIAYRALAHTAAYTSYWLDQINGKTAWDTPDLFNKVAVPSSMIYYYCSGVLTANEKQAFRQMFAHWLNFVRVETPDNQNNGNLLVAAVHAAAYIHQAFPSDTTLRSMCVAVKNKLMYGKEDGSYNDTQEPKIWSGFNVYEGGGIDLGYSGRADHHLASACAITASETTWDDLREALTLNSEARTYFAVPENGSRTWPVGFCARTGNTDEQATGSRLTYQATVDSTGRPLGAATVVSDAAAITAITTAVANLNANDAEKSTSVIHGYDDSLTTATPRTLTRAAVWPQDLPFHPAGSWHATYKALVDATDQTTVYPHFRTAGHTKAIGGTDNPQFWSYKGDDGAGNNFGFIAEGRDTATVQAQYTGIWTGGHLAAYWQDGIGPVLLSVHGKAGGHENGDATGEDSYRWHIMERWPVSGVQCAAKYAIVDKTTDTIEISGDYSDLFQAGQTYVVTETTDGNTRGTYTVAGGGVTYNGVSGNTEITLTSSTGVDIGDYIGFFFHTAHCRQTTESTYTGGASPTQLSVVATLDATNNTGGNGVLVAGEVPVTTVYSIVSGNLRCAVSLAPDATAQTEYTPRIDYVLPIYLRDPDSAATGDASIKYHDGSGWVDLTTTPVSAQYIRVGRDYGSGEQFAWIKFTTSQTIMLSDAVYDQPQYDNKRCRNVLVDLHAARGTPTLWPASASVTYDMLTADPGLPETMELTVSNPVGSERYPVGSIWAVRWTETPNGHTIADRYVEYSNDYAGDEGAATWGAVADTADITSEGSNVYHYKGPGDNAISSSLAAIRVRIVDDQTPTPDEVTAVVAVTATTPTLQVSHAFTDTNGTTLETTSSWDTDNTTNGIVKVGASTGRIEIQGNRGVPSVDQVDGCQALADLNGDDYQYATIVANLNSVTSGGADDRAAGVATRVRVDTAAWYGRGNRAAIVRNAGLSEIRFYLSCYSGTTQYVDVAGSVTTTTDCTIKIHSNDSHTAASIWDGATFVAALVEWSNANNGFDGVAAVAGGYDPMQIDDLNIYTF